MVDEKPTCQLCRWYAANMPEPTVAPTKKSHKLSPDKTKLTYCNLKSISGVELSDKPTCKKCAAGLAKATTDPNAKVAKFDERGNCVGVEDPAVKALAAAVNDADGWNTDRKVTVNVPCDDEEVL